MIRQLNRGLLQKTQTSRLPNLTEQVFFSFFRFAFFIFPDFSAISHFSCPRFHFAFSCPRFHFAFFLHSRRWRPPVIARRGKCRVSSLGVLGRVGERGHPGGRRQREQRRAGARSCNFSGRPQVGACSGTTFRCIPDPETHLPSPPPTRPAIGMLNLPLMGSWSVSGSSRRSHRHRAKPRARSIWADFAVAGP